MTVIQISIKLLIFIAVGYGARRLKVMADGFDKMLSRFLLAVPLPCMIINSFNVTFSMDDLLNCPMLLLLSVCGVAVVYLTVTLCTRRVEPSMGKALRFALTFTNFTLLGLPVVSELYGAKGAFNYVIFTLPVRIIFYGGAPLLVGKGGEKLNVRQTLGQFLCAPVVAVFIGFLLYVTQLQLPVALHGAIETLGNMASPLGLILCGTIIADAKWSGILKFPMVFPVALCRLLLVPGLVLGIEMLLGIDHELIKTTILYYAMPVPSFLPIFLMRYNPDAAQARLAAGYMVVVSTLCCVATIPLWSMILEKVL